MDKLVPISKIELVKRGIGLYIGGKNLSLAKKFLSDKLEVGAISNEGAVEIVNKYLNISKIKESNKICYVSCTQIPDFNVKYFKVNDHEDSIVKDMILASASLPLIYDSTQVYNEKFIDGGISDNTPIQPVYGENCDIIIVVLLSKDAKVDRSLYPNTKLIIIKPEVLEENTLNGTLNLDEEAKRKRIKAGYDDTFNILSPIFELSSYINNNKKDSNNNYLTTFVKNIKSLSFKGKK